MDGRPDVGRLGRQLRARFAWLLVSVVLLVSACQPAAAPPATSAPTPATAAPAQAAPTPTLEVAPKPTVAVTTTTTASAASTSATVPAATTAAAAPAPAIAQLSATNDKLKTFDVSTLYDALLVQSAMDRHVGGP